MTTPTLRSPTAVVMLAALFATGVAAQDAERPTTLHVEPASVATMIETILSGEDTEAAYVALASALGAGAGSHSAAFEPPASALLPTPAEALGVDLIGRIAESRSPAAAASGSTTWTGRLDGWVQSASQRVEALPPSALSALLGGALILLVLMGAWTLARAFGKLRRARSVTVKPRSRLGSRRSRSRVVCRDAARLEARLRAKRAA